MYLGVVITDRFMYKAFVDMVKSFNYTIKESGFNKEKGNFFFLQLGTHDFKEGWPVSPSISFNSSSDWNELIKWIEQNQPVISLQEKIKKGQFSLRYGQKFRCSHNGGKTYSDYILAQPAAYKAVLIELQYGNRFSEITNLNDAINNPCLLFGDNNNFQWEYIQ